MSLIGHLNKPVKDVPDPLHKRGEMDRGSPESIPLWSTDSQETLIRGNMFPFSVLAEAWGRVQRLWEREKPAARVVRTGGG